MQPRAIQRRPAGVETEGWRSGELCSITARLKHLARTFSTQQNIVIFLRHAKTHVMRDQLESSEDIGINSIIQRFLIDDRWILEPGIISLYG